VKFGEQLIVEGNGLKFLPKVDIWSFAMTFKNLRISKQPFKDEQMNTFCAKSKDENL
jgi:hypothetical protein